MDKSFEIEFELEGVRHRATVDVLQGKDHLQYTLSPADDDLRLKYGNQVVHRFPGQPLQFAFPVNHPHQESYNRAVKEALRRALGRIH